MTPPRKTNQQLMKANAKRYEITQAKLDEAMLRLFRLTAYVQRLRTQSINYAYTVRVYAAAIGRGEVYPKVQPPKPKAGRRIEL